MLKDPDDMTTEELIEGLAESLDQMHEDALRGVLPDKETCTSLAQLLNLIQKG